MLQFGFWILVIDLSFGFWNLNFTDTSSHMKVKSTLSNSASSLEEIRHSLSHLLAAAVLKLFPDTKLGIGPTIENGFYYDFLFKKPLTPETLPKLEELMRKYIRAALPFSGKKITPAAAKKLFASQPFKLDLIKEFTKRKKPLTIYHTYSETEKVSLGVHVACRLSHVACFVDLCRGGHVKNTKEIAPDAFKLTHLAGAYWHGSEKNPMLTRIYGVAFNTKEELDAYLKMQEEAKKRDHKILGPALDLFTFSELVGPGLPLFTPKGTVMRDVLDNFVWELRKTRGYERVDIPHITKKNLYERSGHWEKFKDELFRITTREGHLFALKPMNCPHHTQIYARRAWSYRELPQRYASTTKMYRDEQTGELAGLSRVRSITIDDAHVFCRESQMKDEMNAVWDIVNEFYAACGFPTLRVRLSLHDPKQQQKYLGAPELWKKAEAALRALSKSRGAKVEEAVGEAAFYGPKIDFLAQDSLGREWQVATIQLDMNLPERFDLTCTSETGKPERIVMIHAAIMGSLERFMSVLIEHYAGAFPLWLAPVQVAVLPVSEKVTAYGKKVFDEIREAGIRVEIREANETLGKRIRQAELEKIPYVLVVGEKEQTNRTVNVRHCARGTIGEVKSTALLNDLRSEIERKVR